VLTSSIRYTDLFLPIKQTPLVKILKSFVGAAGFYRKSKEHRKNCPA
jgi:hypothetical protein